MKHYSELNLENIKFFVSRKYENNSKTTVEYLELESGFDIETTSILINEEKFSFMYLWTLGLQDKEHIYYGRTWEELKSVLDTISQKFQLSENRRLVVYIHNMGFEFQFMRRYFNWLNVFAVDDRKPIRALCDYGIEFRDSYILSGYSLAKLADNLTEHKIKKLVGDLDYSKVRHEKTYLYPHELEYANNDVEILLYYINEQMKQYGSIIKIPMTNTGRVRQFVRNKCLHSGSNHRKESAGKHGRYRELMNELTLTLEDYIQLKRGFMGGFTHASIKYSGELLENVSSVDFTSSYPYVMLSEKFPMSAPIPCDSSELETILKSDNYCCIFDVAFYGLRSKLTYETYISESKCAKLSKDAEQYINNGRVFQADYLETTITDCDFAIIKKVYTWEKMAVKNVKKFYKRYLPKPVIMSILELYGKKTTLKGVEGKEVEYLLSKGMLNSVYGMCVTDIIRDKITYTDDWTVDKVNIEQMQEQIEKNNNSKTRFLYYPWGVWVTAYARKNLWNGILNVGEDYVYSDTDSIKFLNYEKHIDYINWYNKQCETKLKTMCDFMNIDFNLMKPKTIKGVEKLIGVWDYEGGYTRFKTLGAKRYLVEKNGKLEMTVAGLSKQNGVKYLLENTSHETEDKNGAVFEAFESELYIPANKTGKMTHTYIDEAQQRTITDYNGLACDVLALSGVHLGACEFTLSVAKQYADFLKNFRQGYIFKGVKAI